MVPVSPPPTHIPTTQACELCHSPAKFTNFSGGTMNHAGITSGCTNCHASGKSFFGVTIVTPPATHIPIGTAACESCHAPAKFTNFGGTAMNHAPVAGMACATCHETGKSFYGVTIVTRPTLAQDPNHPHGGRMRQLPQLDDVVLQPASRRCRQPHPDQQPCTLCHTTPGNYAVAHDEPHGHHSGCATCHSTASSFANVVPVAPPPTHVPTRSRASSATRRPSSRISAAAR